MDFVRRGGQALGAYPHFARVRQDDAGKWVVATDKIARTHRMSIGTITAESSMTVKYTSGKTLGHIEEGFIGRLTAGSRFIFAGKVLELLRVRDMTVYVGRARNKSGIVPRWDGGRFSLSTQLADRVRLKLQEAADGRYEGPEMGAIRPLLELQKRWSIIPRPDELLVEHVRLKGAHSVFLFPFQGRAAHEGIGALLAYRLSRRSPTTVTAVANDYGISLRSDEPIELEAEEWRKLLATEGLVDDLVACLNASNLARRQFRDIARIAGLIMPGFPGAHKPMRHVQASSEMFFQVFEEFDPGNLLLDQARREVLNNQFEVVRLRRAMEAAVSMTMRLVRPITLTPLSFPIWAEDLRATTLSSERWADMVRKMVVVLEDAAGGSEREPAGTRESARKRETAGKEVRRDRRSVGR
jgi:ATP-dependent Lhr-like helicase